MFTLTPALSREGGEEDYRVGGVFPSLPRGPLSRPPKVKMKGRDGVGEMVIVMRKGVFHPHPFPLPSRERVHF